MDPRTEIRDLRVGHDVTAFTMDSATWGTLELRTPLVGEHQAWNTALAVRALEALRPPLRPGSGAQVLEGVRKVRWPGRDQIRVVDGTEWLFDVAHNTAGVHSLVRVLDGIDLPTPRIALVGVLGDKEWDEMLPPLLTRVDGAVLTQPPSAPEARRWDPHEAARMAQEALAGQGEAGPWIRVEPVFETALRAVRESSAGGTAVVTGSCHTVGDALRALEVEPFPDEST
jgi:dihydrofolate synthase/folylpolyglutamate synthase